MKAFAELYGEDRTAERRQICAAIPVIDLDGQTTLMVTHDPRAAVTADRVLYLTDGRVVADLQRPTEDDVLAVMNR